MSNKSKKFASFCCTGAIYCFGLLFIYVISVIIYLLDTSMPCSPTRYNDPIKYIKEPNHTYEISKQTDNRDQDNVTVSRSITVAFVTVVCHDPTDLSTREEALVLLKSTIISALLYKTFPINIKFHIFLEHWTDQKYFMQNIKPFSETPHAIRVDLYFYSVIDVVPKEYHNLLFGSNLRCNFVPVFLPDVLEKVDAILYLDKDVIITGNLREIWNNFYKFSDIQLVGAVMDIEPENEPWFHVYQDSFLDVPVPTARGLNEGVLLMNLTRMREYQFYDKIMKLYKDYWFTLTHQSLLNALLFYNPYLLYLLPCQYNFRPTACSLGFYCSGVLNDSTGIQIIRQYTKFVHMRMDNAFSDIAKTYQKITDPNINLGTNLLIRIRDIYKNDLRSVNDHGNCNGVLKSLLFRRFFV